MLEMLMAAAQELGADCSLTVWDGTDRTVLCIDFDDDSYLDEDYEAYDELLGQCEEVEFVDDYVIYEFEDFDVVVTGDYAY